jgi:hypothetical protein
MVALSGMSAVFDCFVEKSRGRQSGAAPSSAGGAATAKVTAVAACLVPSEEIAGFDGLWRLLLMKHDLPASGPDDWCTLIEKHDTESTTALRELTGAASNLNGLGFVVAIGRKTWGELPQPTRRRLGSAQTLCFLRLMRIVVDKLEGCGESARIAVRLRLDMAARNSSMRDVQAMMAADTRARERIASLSFVNPRNASHFSAIDLVLQNGLQELTRTTELAPTQQASQLAQAAFPANFALELWNGDFVSRHLESLEWGQSQLPAVRKRGTAAGARTK